jgi:predicted transcriptional regulator
MVKATTIQISLSTKSRLERLKDYTRETYEDVINKLIDIVAEEHMELSEQTKRDIEESRKQIREGKFVTEEEMRRRLGLK